MAKFTTYFSGLTQDTDPQGDSDFVMTYDTSTAGIKKVLIDDLGFLTSGLSTDTKLDDLAAPDDNTDLNSDTDSHGLLMKLSGDSDTYLNGVGGWATVTSSGGGFTTGDIHQVELYRGTLTTDGNFDVSTISQDYDHLLIYGVFRSSVSADVDYGHLYLNNDTTATNYFRQQFSSENGNTQAGAEGDDAYAFGCNAVNSVSDSFGFFECFIPNYTGSKKKVFKTQSNFRYLAGVSRIQMHTLEWESTAAISRITIQPDGYATDKFITGSFLQIIGIKTEA